MRKSIVFFLLFFSLVLASGQMCFAQQPSQGSQPQQPLNASVSGFGTSFVFGPAPICVGCVETEFGLLSLQDGRFLPTVLTVAPAKNTDVSILVNLLDCEMPEHSRTTHFGNRFDFVVREQIFAKNGWVLAIAPHGTVLVRGTDGGRVGGTFAAQYGKGNNTWVTNLTLTRAIGSSDANPEIDYQGVFDYSRSLGKKGASVFAGFAHEALSRNPWTVGTEAGVVVPFRNGQVEFATEQLNLNQKPVWQFQARVVVNWGKLFRR